MMHQHVECGEVKVYNAIEVNEAIPWYAFQENQMLHKTKKIKIEKNVNIRSNIYLKLS